MPLEYLPLAVILFLVALGLVLRNDRLHPKKKAPQPEKQQPVSLMSYLLVFPALGVFIFIGYVFRNNPHCGWIVPLVFIAVVVLIMLFLWRKALWLYMRSILFGGPMPRLIIKNANNELETKCPRCNARITVKPIQAGEQAFECGNCGEKGKWLTDSK
jgi:DNA-directed RNA polymerase subunit RPC12/RpoP